MTPVEPNELQNAGKKDYSMVSEYISASDEKIFPSFSRLLIYNPQL